jgi:Glycosyltransferase family 87
VKDNTPADHDGSLNADLSYTRSLTGRIVRLCLPALLWTIVAIAAPTFILQIKHQDRAIQEDFAVYYFSALEMRHGVSPYTTDLTKTARASGFDIHGIALSTDPPTLDLIFKALTYLPLHTAYCLWQAINLTCIAVAILLLIGFGSGLRISTSLTIGALFVLYPSVASHFWFGQSKFPLLLLFVLMMRSMRRERDATAGSSLALATLIHVFPIVLSGYLVLTRRWRVLGWTAAALLVGAVATIGFVGWRECVDFIAAIPSISNASWNIIQRNLSAPVFIARLLRWLSPNPGFAPNLIARALVIAVDLLIVAATTKVTLALPPQDDPDSRVFSLWVATAVFLLPVAWDYDLVLMLIPFSVLAVAGARGEASRRAIAMAVLSYLLLIWWEYVALSANKFGFFSMLAAYLSAYWLAADQPVAVSVPLISVPGEIWRRLALTAE